MYIVNDLRLCKRDCFRLLYFYFYVFFIALGLSTRPLEQNLHIFPSTRCCFVPEDARDLLRATAFPSPRATAARRTFKSTSSPAISKRP